MKHDFRDIIFRGSNNKIISEVLRTLNARITRLRAVGLASTERRDRAGAAAISRRHVKQAAKTALASLKT